MYHPHSHTIDLLVKGGRPLSGERRNVCRVGEKTNRVLNGAAGVRQAVSEVSAHFLAQFTPHKLINVIAVIFYAKLGTKVVAAATPSVKVGNIYR